MKPSHTAHEEILQDMAALQHHIVDWTIQPAIINGQIWAVYAVATDDEHLHIFVLPMNNGVIP